MSTVSMHVSRHVCTSMGIHAYSCAEICASFKPLVQRQIADLELCAVGEVARTSTEQIGASAWNDLVPGLGVTINEDAWWAQFLDPVPTRDPWSEQIGRDPSHPLKSDARRPASAQVPRGSNTIVWESAAVKVSEVTASLKAFRERIAQ